MGQLSYYQNLITKDVTIMKISAEAAQLGSISQKLKVNISYMAWKDLSSYAARSLRNWS